MVVLHVLDFRLFVNASFVFVHLLCSHTTRICKDPFSKNIKEVFGINFDVLLLNATYVNSVAMHSSKLFKQVKGSSSVDRS